MKSFLVSAGIAAFVVCGLAGCGGGLPKQKTYPVSGSVTLDGKPLAGVTVVFHAVDKTNFKWGELPQGRTDESGKFTLFTYAVGDGAPAGRYLVGIEFAAAESDDGGDQVKRPRNANRIPLRYMDPQKSGITATIDSATRELPPFALTSK